MEYCNCLSFISLQHEAYFNRQLATNCSINSGICARWQNRFLLGYWATPPPEGEHRYLFGDDNCYSWPIENSQSAQEPVWEQVFNPTNKRRK